MLVLEGFILGFFGSLHCAGMCGPLALAIPIGQRSVTYRIAGGLLYNFGRAITYAILGVIVGFLGEGIRFSGFQQWVSIAIGVIMIISVILPGIIHITPLLQRATTDFLSPLKKQIRQLFNNHRFYPLLLIGLLNGLLPCGLVYIALSGAIVSSSLAHSVAYMFLFGLGTLPMMFALVFFSNLIKNKFIGKLRAAIPIFVVILGVLFILRGLNLGIPYISPKMSKSGTEMPAHCH